MPDSSNFRITIQDSGQFVRRFKWTLERIDEGSGKWKEVILQNHRFKNASGLSATADLAMRSGKMFYVNNYLTLTRVPVK
jgi:hypothetical protein